MNANRELFYIFIMFVTILGAGCSMHGKDSYNIKRAWADQHNLYVLYEKEYYFVSASLLNIHGGTILYEKSNFHLKKFNKNVVINGSLNLESGGELIVPVDGNVDLHYYVDQDLLVQEKHGITTITSGKYKGTLKCDHNIWADAVPLKFVSDVFYCGFIFSTPTGNVKRLTPEVEASIQILRLNENKNLGMQRLLYIADGKYLIVKSDFDSSPFMLKISTDNPDNFVLIKPSHLNDEKLSSRKKYKAHSKSKFVFELPFDHKNEHDEIYFCDSEKCEVINHRPYSYLVVDDTSGDILFFHRRNVVTPEISIEIVRHKDLKSAVTK